MKDRVEHPQLREVRALIDNIRHGAAVEASAERLQEMFAALIDEGAAAAASDGEVEIYQKALG